jgi:hypothetical protein
MLGQAPASVRAQYGLAATRLEQAELAWQSGNTGTARARAVDARRTFSALLHTQDYERDASLGVANALLLQGKLDLAAGEATSARKQWSRALDAMHVFGADSQDPDQLGTAAEVLTRLGRRGDAQPLIARLDAMHYRDPAFVAWRHTDIAAAVPQAVVENVNRQTQR